MSETVADPSALVDAVMTASSMATSYLHGDRHWRAVALAALELAPYVPGADTSLALLFALFHDSRRENDDEDPGHGVRGAALAACLHGRAFELTVPGLATLIEACARHTDGEVSDDPSIGLCWDADRLNLWRVGKEPDPRRLSTVAARNPAAIAAAADYHGLAPSWSALFERLRPEPG
ncbi:MAG: hypothetical protein U0R69_00135 [Gaiellales bacterium]